MMVVMEPTRNAWVPLAAWFRRHGAVVVVVPSERSSDLRAYYAKHAKTDRLDAALLARLPVLHPDGLNPETALGPGDPLKRAVKIRSGLVHRRTTSMQRLDSLLELLGPQWIEALGADMTPTVFRFLIRWANPYHVKRMGKARLGRWFQRQTRKAWGDQRAAEVVAAAETTLALWGNDGIDFEALAADIAVEASWLSSSHRRSSNSTIGSPTSTQRQIPRASCCLCPGSATYLLPRFADGSATSRDSPAWLQLGRSPGSCHASGRRG